MEAAEFLLKAVASVGFPIVVALIMIYVTWVQNKTHREEMNSLKEALNNNTIALTKLYEKLDK